MQQQSYEGKVALVTGGAGGIGRVTALAFAQAGAAVVVADRDAAAAELVAKEITSAGGRAAAVQVDVTRNDEVKRMVAFTVERFGRLDAAFNNAGVELEAQPTHECEEDTFDLVMGVNLKGVWLCMKHELTQMLAQGGGVIGLTKAAAAEYGRHKIRVNAVCPGVIATPMMERAFAADPRRQPRMERLHLLKRVGQPEEIAEAVLFLCSDAASFVTGHPMAVDGGMVAV